MFEYVDQDPVVVDGHAPIQSLSIPLVNDEWKPTLEQTIAAWLHNIYSRSESEESRAKYTDIITRFRAVLQSYGYDLDSDPRIIAMIAQGWAATPVHKESIAPKTFNWIIGTLSSFYEYAIKHDVLTVNPMKKVDKRRGDSEYAAVALEGDIAKEKLEQIDRSTILGLRDYAVLSLLLSTGRRRAEVANLEWRDLSFVGDMLTINFRRCKGKKRMSDEIAPGTRDAILAYLRVVYGHNLDNLPPDAPIWLIHSNNQNATQGGKLSKVGLNRICGKRLGTPKVHTTRHTFAVRLWDTCHDLQLVQDRLGHANPATTGVYLKRLMSHRNPHAVEVSDSFGINGAAAPPTSLGIHERAERIKQTLRDHPERSNADIAREYQVTPAAVRHHRLTLGL